MFGWLVQAARDRGSSPVGNTQRGVLMTAFHHKTTGRENVAPGYSQDVITHQNKTPVLHYAERTSRWLWLVRLRLSGPAASRGRSFFSRWRRAKLSDLKRVCCFRKQAVKVKPSLLFI